MAMPAATHLSVFVGRNRLALSYLALPNAIFLAGWLSPVFAAAGLLALAVALLPLLERPARGPETSPRPARGLALLVIAICWCALGGAGHLFYANPDWLVRDAVLRDLAVGDWPVVYAGSGESQAERVLRAPIAFYLPAALGGGLFGPAFADLALLLWTTLGVWLLLSLVVDREDSTSTVIIKVLTVITFSGMDVVGTLLSGEPVSWTAHLEWWTGIFQFSSHTTQLFWVPGHALPGWIAAAVIYRQWNDPRLVRLLPALLAVIPLWSPLTALGVLPLAVAAFAGRLRRDGWRGAVPFHAWLGAVVIMLVIGAFITADGDRIMSGWVWQIVPDWPWLVLQLIAFFLLEFVILARLVSLVHRPPSLSISVVVLALLPLYVFGPGNDLVMRASIPALMVLSLTLADAAPGVFSAAMPRRVSWTLALVLLLGCVTPATEILRAIAKPRWAPSASRTVVEATQGSHYLADRANPRLSGLLRAGSNPIRPAIQR